MSRKDVIRAFGIGFGGLVQGAIHGWKILEIIITESGDRVGI